MENGRHKKHINRPNLLARLDQNIQQMSKFAISKLYILFNNIFFFYLIDSFIGREEDSGSVREVTIYVLHQSLERYQKKVILFSDARSVLWSRWEFTKGDSIWEKLDI